MLWPKNCNGIEDIPFDLCFAIEHAYRVLNWMEDLSSEELPPEWMWPFDKPLEEWFEEVKTARDIKYGTGDDDDYGDVQNEYAKEFLDR